MTTEGGLQYPTPFRHIPEDYCFKSNVLGFLFTDPLQSYLLLRTGNTNAKLTQGYKTEFDMLSIP